MYQCKGLILTRTYFINLSVEESLRATDTGDFTEDLSLINSHLSFADVLENGKALCVQRKRRIRLQQ